jgi:hypothetical protein
MTTISIQTDIKQAQRDLDIVRKKQIPYATKLTVNALADNVKKRTDKDIKTKLDRPTRYALNMMRIKYANNTDLTSQVKVKDSATVTKRGARGPDQVLGHLFSGGRRQRKGFEGLLVRSGVMPSGMWAVPGEGVRLDMYGNIPSALIVKLVAYFNSFQESGFMANMTDKGRKSFNKRTSKQIKGASTSQYTVIKVKKPGGLHPGIWQRIGFGSGKAIKPIIMFVSKDPSYKQYFDLDSVAKEIIGRDAEFEFDKAMALAIATAK